MHQDFLDTVFALVFAAILIAVFWNIIMYYSEMGSEEGKKEYKGLVIGSITWLLLMLILFALVQWVRGLIGI